MTILPWDILSILDDNLSLVNVLKLGQIDSEKLPVTVTIGSTEYTHMLEEETFIGLLLFSDPSIGNFDFNIRIFGVRFTSDYIVPEIPEGVKHSARYVFEYTPEDDYNVDVTNRRYGVSKVEFMRGFTTTEALWIYVDQHNYLKGLAYLLFRRSNR